MNDSVFIYRIDRRDVIISVSENWESFARANSWSDGCSPEDVQGKSLWDFIHDAETRHLYRSLLERVRSGTPCGPIPFRCDSPDKRRFLELVLSPLSDRHVKFTSTIIRIEQRDPVDLLDSSRIRSAGFIRMCTLCKRIAMSEGNWVEIEEGLTRLALLARDRVPRLTHGVCPDCFQTLVAELHDAEPVL